MKKNNHRPIVAVYLLSVLALTKMPVTWAAEVTYGATLSSEYTSNITLNPVGQKEVASSIGGFYDYTEDTSEVQANVNATVNLVYYLKNRVSDKLTGSIDALARWTIDPNFFYWVLQDRFTETQIDVLTGFNPGNTINVNALTTGPSLTWRLSGVHDINLDIRASDFRFAQDNLVNTTDNNRLVTDLTWVYKVSPVLTLTTLLRNEQVFFKDTINNVDYTQNNISTSLAYRRYVNTYLLAAGYAEVEDDNGLITRYPTYRMDWISRRTPNTTIELDLSRAITDNGAALFDLIEGDDALAATVGEIFEVTTARIVLNTLAAINSFTAEFNRRLRSYNIASNLSNDSNSAILNFTRVVSVGTQIGARVVYRRTEYENQIPSRSDDDQIYSFDLSHRVRRNMLFNVRTGFTQRDSTDPASEYEEVRVLFSIQYVSQ